MSDLSNPPSASSSQEPAVLLLSATPGAIALTDAERLQLAMEAGRLGSFSLDLATGQMLCTTQCKQNFGLSADSEFTYEALLALIYEEDRPAMQKAVARALHERIDYEAEYRVLTPAKETRWIVARGRGIYGDDGRPTGMVGVTQNITRQRQNEDALRLSEASVKEQARRIRLLYEMTSRTDLDFAEKVQCLLHAGREWLGLEAGVLARTDCDAGSYTIVQIDGAGETLPVGYTCPLGETYCSETVKQGSENPPIALEHIGATPEWREHPAYKMHGSEAYHAAVVRVNGNLWGTLSFFAHTPHVEPFTEFEQDLVRLIAQWIGSEVARKEAEEALRLRGAQQRRFVREMLASVTEGKLCLSDEWQDLPDPLPVSSDVVELTPASVRRLRKQVEAIADALHLSTERTQDLLTAVGEASMNAVRHGGGGTGQVYTDPERCIVQVWIQDHGKGIREEDLHRATLEKGWSGGGSLGHGFFLMLRTVDRTYLLTGAAGTTVVLEQEQTPPQPAWIASPVL